MGVYIKGMEMPKKCSECPFWTITSCTATFQGKKSCPLIEVPEPHGRLIDADELIDLLKEVGFGERSIFEIIAGSAVLAAIDEAPTIIPSSEEE